MTSNVRHNQKNDYEVQYLVSTAATREIFINHLSHSFDGKRKFVL